MGDIMLDMEALKSTKNGLITSIAAFEDAAKTNNALEAAVANPDGRSALRNKVSDFESAWDGKRAKLKDKLDNIEGQLSSLVEGWETWDTDTAAQLDGQCEAS